MSAEIEIRDRPTVPPEFQYSMRSWLASEAAFWLAHTVYWALVFGLWLLVRTVYLPKNIDPWPLIAIRVVACLLATAGMRALAKKHALLERLNVSRIGLVAGGLLSAVVVITLAAAVVDAFQDRTRVSRARLVADLAVNMSVLGNWCAVYFGLQLIRERNTIEFRAIEAESLALRNELNHIQAQISPHFLFNALNTVLASRDDPEAIETVTQSLANYLRFLLRPAATLEPLAREMDALEQYLTVQSARFGDRLATMIECDLDARELLVPPVLVQPLVENALKYGSASETEPLSITISAQRQSGWLFVEVANTGRWRHERSTAGTGTGLKSLVRRLRLLVGTAASVNHVEQDGWVRVRVSIPITCGDDVEPRT